MPAPDFTDKYNTQLSPQQEQQFQTWLQMNSNMTGRDLKKDLFDYDLRGLFLKEGGADLQPGHQTDEFKKPNHPTFSNESKYNGVDGYQGGSWIESPDGLRYHASRTNMQFRNEDELRKYFEENEKESGAQLVVPKDPTEALWPGEVFSKEPRLDNSNGPSN